MQLNESLDDDLLPDIFWRKFVLFGCEQHFGGIVAPVEQRFKTMGEFGFVELLNSNLFALSNKKIPIEAFLTLDVYKKHIGLVRIEMRAGISLFGRFCKANVKNPKNHSDNTGTN